MRRTTVLLLAILGTWGLASTSGAPKKIPARIKMNTKRDGTLVLEVPGNGSKTWLIQGVFFDNENNRISCSREPVQEGE